MSANSKPEVLVVGSGAAGLTAALSASEEGARVLLLERSDHVGGTTAVSGGALWIPMNPHMRELGVSDSRDEALGYCMRLTLGRVDPSLLEHFVDTGHQLVAQLEQTTPLRFTPWSIPDYRQEVPGAKLAGRSIEPDLYDRTRLGDWSDRIRPSAHLPIPLKLEESTVTYAKAPETLPRDLIGQRMKAGVCAVGNALVGMLLEACLERGVEVVTSSRARSLELRDGRIVGIRVEGPHAEERFSARAVILASGGFEWSPELVGAFLPGALTHPQSPPFNEGDGLRMAMEVGASLGNMSEAWWYPTGVVPGEVYEGHPLSRPIALERSAPHCIVVNRRGERFVNEAANYNDMAKALLDFDATTFGYRNLPCWSVFDSRFRARSRVLNLDSNRPDPDWLLRGENLAQLAERAGIDPVGLVGTVERFNALVGAGRDTDYGRGESAYDCATGDVRLEEPNLGPLSEPPFYALPIHLGAVGTKGGPRTDEHARVLDVRKRPIPGLYAAGNAAAGIAGPAYFGGGTSIGCAVVMGHSAGRHAASLT
ncbi:FAD-dependent oxidoreductase [Myxococcota bacterium]|nr:FAD-dependent oxidoreductase [Myxococcota bacterium]